MRDTHAARLPGDVHHILRLAYRLVVDIEYHEALGHSGVHYLSRSDFRYLNAPVKSEPVEFFPVSFLQFRTIECQSAVFINGPVGYHSALEFDIEDFFLAVPDNRQFSLVSRTIIVYRLLDRRSVPYLYGIYSYQDIAGLYTCLVSGASFQNLSYIYAVK